MINVVVTSVLLITNFILQSTVLHAIEIRGVIPDTMLIIVVSYALLRGQNSGAATGFFAGLLYDIFFGNSLGFYALMGMLTGYFCGICHRNFYRENFVLPVTLSAVTNIIMGLVIYFTGFLFNNRYNVFYYVVSVIIPQAVYTGIVALPVYRILYGINKKVEIKEKERRKLF